MERNFDLKDALRGGITPEQMLADFQKQLAEAQAEVATEQATAKDELEEVRADMIDSIIDYLVAIGLIDEDEVDTDEMADELVKAIKEAEKEMAAVAPFLSILREMKVEKQDTKPNPDAVIGEFLKTLR